MSTHMHTPASRYVVIDDPTRARTIAVLALAVALVGLALALTTFAVNWEKSEEVREVGKSTWESLTALEEDRALRETDLYAFTAWHQLIEVTF